MVSEPELIFQDHDILVINKPPGLRTIPDGYNPALPHLAGLLKEQYGPVWVVHRLDKDTSGIILFARNAEAHRTLNLQFEHREIHKVYHALVTGSPEWDEYEIDLPLRVNGDRKHRTVIDPRLGRPAATGCRTLRRYAGVTLLAAQPHTGYTHQIRAHLAALGFPLLGDPLYHSPQPENLRAVIPSFPRTALHAFQLSFLHPTLAQPVIWQAPYAPDFQAFFEQY